jgi:hypothetical protein
MNDRKWWFKRRRYGWGWYPVTFSGWLVTFLYVLGVIGLASWSPPGDLIAIALMTVALLVICIKKGPAPRWRWGKSPLDSPEDDF